MSIVNFLQVCNLFILYEYYIIKYLIKHHVKHLIRHPAASPCKERRVSMHQTPDILKVNILKKELSSCIVKHNYNLLSPEVLSLSCQIDELLLPIFQTQLELYNFYKQYRN